MPVPLRRGDFHHHLLQVNCTTPPSRKKQNLKIQVKEVWGRGFGVWGLGFGVWGLVQQCRAPPSHNFSKVRILIFYLVHVLNAVLWFRTHTYIC